MFSDFLDMEFREATKGETESVERYIQSISTPTGINFEDSINEDVNQET